MMRILLFNPPFYRFLGLEQDYVPINLLEVGAKLESEDHIVYIKNLEIEKNLNYRGYNDRLTNYNAYLSSVSNRQHYIWEEARQTIEDINPDKIGITVKNVHYKSVLMLIKIADEYKIPVMVGGYHPTIFPISYPKNVEVIQGEFESENGRVKDLDSLPLTNYHNLMDLYSPNGYAHVLTARGCPFNCRFCNSNAMWGNKVSFKSINRVLEEMKYIENFSDCDCFTIWDETFTINKKRVKDFCNKYNLKSNWRCDTRADTIDNTLVKMMKNSGCVQMSIGIESGNNHILSYVGKKETIENYEKAAEILNKNNIQWKAYCIIGFPEETEEDMVRTIEFTKSLQPFRITLSFFTPYFGTELYDECLEKKLITNKYDLALYSHQSPYNYFCPKVEKNRYMELKKELSEEVDKYNQEALKVWK